MTTCPDTPPRRRQPGAHATLGLLIATTLAACGTPTDETTPAPAWTYTSTLTAIPGPLTPAQPAPNEFEQHPAVQAIRATSAMVVWSALMDTCDSDQYLALIDPNQRPVECGGSIRLNDHAYRIGPLAMTPIGVSTDPDGSTRVTACLLETDASYADPATDEILEERAGRSVFSESVVSTLTAEEIADLPESVASPPLFRVRWSTLSTSPEDTAVCDTVPIVVQVFDDWQDTYWFARPFHSPETRTRDDMP